MGAARGSRTTAARRTGFTSRRKHRPEARPDLPSRCRGIEAPKFRAADGALEVSETLDCGPEGLADARVGVRGLSTSTALLRVQFADGRRQQALLDGVRPSVRIRASVHGWWAVASEYGRLGLEHIAGGADHLLFVAGLLVLAHTLVRVLAAVTAFTLGHSVTLALASTMLPSASGFRLPMAAVETAIAASVFWLAVELARPGAEPGLLRRRPWLAAAGFGLLHGLGFASALSDVGLPRDEIVGALLAFNAGIEIGQILFVLVAGGLWRALGRVAPAARWSARASTGTTCRRRSSSSRA